MEEDSQRIISSAGTDSATTLVQQRTAAMPRSLGWTGLIALAMIWFFTILNLRGITLVGASSTLFVVFMKLPFVVMIFFGVTQISHNPFVPMLPADKSLTEVLSTGLLMTIWFISGFEGIATASEEIKNSEKPSHAHCCSSFHSSSRVMVCRFS